MGATDIDALERLIAIARTDTGQARRVADFLLAWWNAGSCGGFDLTNLWAVDRAIADDMATVVRIVARLHSYPDTLGYKADFEAIVRAAGVGVMIAPTLDETERWLIVESLRQGAKRDDEIAQANDLSLHVPPAIAALSRALQDQAKAKRALASRIEEADGIALLGSAS